MSLYASIAFSISRVCAITPCMMWERIIYIDVTSNEELVFMRPDRIPMPSPDSL